MRNPSFRSLRRGGAVLVLLATSALAQTEPEKQFVERVEVNVRTVLVRITDRAGKAPSPAPGPEDLEVLEDGKPMRVLGVDPARPLAPIPTAAQPQPLPTKPEPSAALGAPRAIGIPQHLYVDTTLLDAGSVRRLAAAFDRNLDDVLANGPLEIVVADPQPRQTLASTRDPQAIRRALEDLGKNVADKQILISQRRETLDTLRNGGCVNVEMTTRQAAEQELRIIQDSLERLLRWAVSLGGQRPDVVYFVSDGFDSDVTEQYRRVIVQLGTKPPAILCAGMPTDVAQAQQLSTSLELEFAPRGAELVGSIGRALAALSVEAVPIALSGNVRDFGNDASMRGGDGFAATSGSVSLFARPVEPLRAIAEATGGEVVTSAGHLPAVLDAYDSSFVVSFRSEHAPDGKMHGLKISSRREGLTVRSPQYMTEGSLDSVASGLTVRALNEPPPQGGMPIRLSVDGVAQNGKQYTGVLHVDADLATLVSTLELLQGGRMRVTIAVDVTGAKEPFTTRQEFDVPAKQAGWGADIPISWPAKGRKVAVTVEELKTGTRATGAVDLPK